MITNHSILPVHSLPSVDGSRPLSRTANVQESPDQSRQQARPSELVNRQLATSDELAEKYSEKAAGKALSLSSSGDYSYSQASRKALDAYQQTAEAGREYTEGVLVGVDLFA